MFASISRAWNWQEKRAEDVKDVTTTMSCYFPTIVLRQIALQDDNRDEASAPCPASDVSDTSSQSIIAAGAPIAAPFENLV